MATDSNTLDVPSATQVHDLMPCQSTHTGSATDF